MLFDFLKNAFDFNHDGKLDSSESAALFALLDHEENTDRNSWDDYEYDDSDDD